MKSVAILAVLAVTHTSASMLRLLPGEPCVAHGNSSESQSVFNITKIFTYPVEAAGGGHWRRFQVLLRLCDRDHADHMEQRKLPVRPY